MDHRELEKIYLPMFAMSFGMLALTIYWFGYPFFAHYGLVWSGIDEILCRAVQAGALENCIKIKVLIIAVIILTVIVKSGKSTKAGWLPIFMSIGVFFVLFMWPYQFAPTFILGTIVGYAGLNFSIAFAGRKVKSMGGPDNSGLETFEQCNDKIQNEYSINIPTKYYWKGKWRKGWINVVNPFRATAIFGTPGSGKSFSVYKPFIQQTMAKGFSAFCYDYKFPDLTEEIYNEYLENRAAFMKRMGKVPQFCVINFDDPRYSMRCNPVAPRYITDPADTAEIADLIMRNVNPQSIEKEDFFTLSAKAYIDALIWYLRIFQDGRFCTFPHLIELMGRNYEAVFEILQKYDDCRVKIQPFQNALIGKAMEQLQGQIASAQIPLLRFASPALYWVLSGDDFSLDINSREDPKILCIGNNPDRQSIYGTTLALYTARLFRQINHKGKHPCAVLLDELPTIFIKGLDNLIATARSNKVCIVFGAQDKSQLMRDYGEKEAKVVFNTVGNIISGQVNGETAKSLSETFGKEFRIQQSETTGGQSDTINTSFHQEEILPQSKIETLSQGTFFGKVADDNKQKVNKKLFCGEIQINLKQVAQKAKRAKKLPKFNDAEYVNEMNRHLDDKDQRQADFDDKAVADKIKANADFYIREYITAELRTEERKKKYANEFYNAFTEGGTGETLEIDARVSALSSEDKDRLVDRIIKAKQREDVDQKLRENYDKIKKEVDSIFLIEGVPEKKDAAGGGGPVSSVSNDPTNLADMVSSKGASDTSVPDEGTSGTNGSAGNETGFRTDADNEDAGIPDGLENIDLDPFGENESNKGADFDI